MQDPCHRGPHFRVRECHLPKTGSFILQIPHCSLCPCPELDDIYDHKMPGVWLASCAQDLSDVIMSSLTQEWRPCLLCTGSGFRVVYEAPSAAAPTLSRLPHSRSPSCNSNPPTPALALCHHCKQGFLSCLGHYHVPRTWCPGGLDKHSLIRWMLQ